MSKLRRNTIIYSFGSALPRVGTFLLLPILTRYLTPTEYGTVSAMLIVGTIATILFTFAIDRSIWRLYHDYSVGDRKALLGTLMMAIAVTATLGLSLALLGRDLLQLVFPSIPFVPFYVYALLAAYFGAFSVIPKISLKIEGKAATFVTLAGFEFLLTNALVLWFVIHGGGAAGMLKGQMYGALVCGIGYLGIATRVARPTFRLDMLVASIKFSAPLIPSLLFAWILNVSDRVFLGRYRSLAEVGTYSLGYKVGSASTTLTGAFYQAYNPIFYKLANSEDQSRARAAIARYNSAFLAVSAAIGFSIAFAAPEAVVLLFPAAYQGVVGVIQIVAFGYIVSQAQGLLELQIYQSKRTVGLMWVYALGAATNIALNVVLVPLYGSYAAAWTTTAAFVVMFAADYWLARRCYFVPFPWRDVLAWAAGMAVLLVGGSLVPMSHPIASFAAKAVIIALVFVGVEARYDVLGFRRLIRRRGVTAGEE